MDRLRLLCGPRVCVAIKDKYKDDARHRMEGLVWSRGGWETVDSEPRTADREVETVTDLCPPKGGSEWASR